MCLILYRDTGKVFLACQHLNLVIMQPYKIIKSFIAFIFVDGQQIRRHVSDQKRRIHIALDGDATYVIPSLGELFLAVCIFRVVVLAGLDRPCIDFIQRHSTRFQFSFQNGKEHGRRLVGYAFAETFLAFELAFVVFLRFLGPFRKAGEVHCLDEEGIAHTEQTVRQCFVLEFAQGGLPTGQLGKPAPGFYVPLGAVPLNLFAPLLFDSPVRIEIIRICSAAAPVHAAQDASLFVLDILNAVGQLRNADAVLSRPCEGLRTNIHADIAAA